ncbi:carboxymuconolactone decarboxylase family protein [Galbibacter sp. EGI 63066]|uniref:carboxymuconolactone decarboxylase family protein n=1 Tax=Galbibacter sp. EGI 63066 TaxID=2993559 RepID=UPI0022493F9B|nr:carboxymuconolactone decarboxylase family protein [Galbibacter sp. EGI 63066]MCX2680013.1 carboxymuconolactone decarboxylase family protein [Galbibacter sp. EGI 63066]
MKQRLNLNEKGSNALKSLYGISKHLYNSTIDKQLFELLYFRVSQINGCAFCLDMHSKDLLAKGESAQRLFVLDAWREAPFFSEKECAALSWAEAVTKLDNGHVPDDTYEEVSKHFTEAELIDLTLAVTAINTYNRFNIAFGTPAGTYEVGQFS